MKKDYITPDVLVLETEPESYMAVHMSIMPGSAEPDSPALSKGILTASDWNGWDDEDDEDDEEDY